MNSIWYSSTNAAAQLCEGCHKEPKGHGHGKLKYGSTVDEWWKDNGIF